MMIMRISNLILLSCLCLMTVSCQNYDADVVKSSVSNFSANYSTNFSTLPFDVPDNKVKPLLHLLDPALQTQLMNRINANPQWKALIHKKKMAVGLVDLRDPQHIKFARINGNHMMYAASLPKIAILLAAMDALEKGEIDESPELRSDMRRMISKSDNMASTRLIDLLGYEKIESVLRDPQYDFYNKDLGGGLWVGKRYASMGRRYPEPLKGLSHAASVSQVCRFYYLLLHGKLVSQEKSKFMLEMMQDPELHHKFVNSVETLDPDARMFRKSGSWKCWHADSIMVWSDPGRRYILVGLVEDPSGETILRQLVFAVEEVLREKV